MLPPPSTSTLFPYTTLFRSYRLPQVLFLYRNDLRHTIDVALLTYGRLEPDLNYLPHIIHTDEAAAKSENISIIVDRKSTRLNSSHLGISYAVFCLKKKKKNK